MPLGRTTFMEDDGDGVPDNRRNVSVMELVCAGAHRTFCDLMYHC
jgi:hypothetical protein